MKSLYILPYELFSENGAVVVEYLIKTIKKQSKSIALFSPIAHSEEKEKISLFEHHGIYIDSGFGVEDLEKAAVYEKLNDLIYNLIDRYKALEEKYDFIICRGIANFPTISSIGFDINIEIAKNLNTPVVNLLDGRSRTVLELINKIKIEANFIRKIGCARFATFISGLHKNKIEDFRDKIGHDYPNIYLLPDIENCEVCSNSIYMSGFENCLEKLPPQKNVTPIMFEYNLFEKAKKDKKRIVLPESSDDRVLLAAEVILTRDVADIILLGNPDTIDKKSKSLGIDISKAHIIEPCSSKLIDIYTERFYELRKSKGMTLELAKEVMKELNYFGTMMVYSGDADGMVSGAIHTTSDTIRPALQIIKTKPDVSIISSIFFMCLDTKVLVYGDCAVNRNPSAEELAQIAISSANTSKSFGIEPKIAMLSYSTGNSGDGADVDKIKEAVKLIKEKQPDLLVDGPIQYDAAVDPIVARAKLPDSKVAGQANVLIFPDLNAGNITYKAVQRSSNAISVGPVLQGLKKPINDLSRGCLVADIVNTVAITAIQAQNIIKG